MMLWRCVGNALVMPWSWFGKRCWCCCKDALAMCLLMLQKYVARCEFGAHAPLTVPTVEKACPQYVKLHSNFIKDKPTNMYILNKRVQLLIYQYFPSFRCLSLGFAHSRISGVGGRSKHFLQRNYLWYSKLQSQNKPRTNKIPTGHNRVRAATPTR